MARYLVYIELDEDVTVDRLVKDVIEAAEHVQGAGALSVQVSAELGDLNNLVIADDPYDIDPTIIAAKGAILVSIPGGLFYKPQIMFRFFDRGES